MKANDSPTNQNQPDIFTQIANWEQSNQQATLTEIEEAVDAQLNQLRQHLIQEMLDKRAHTDAEEKRCPNCDTVMVKNGQKAKKLKAKGGNQLKLTRYQYRCLDCGTTTFPPR